jgi:alkylresorcinol/alkylpyrone synthase
MTRPVAMLGLATAVPPHVLEQTEVARRAEAAFGDTFARFPQLADVFLNTGIERRHAARPIDWYERPLDWTERSAAYLESGSELFIEAAENALIRANCRARDVDVVVTVSSTGIATPSLEAHVAGRIGLRSDAMRVPVFGLGCAGGVSGLALAAQLARAAPGKVVLLVVVELCTLAFRRDRATTTDVVATALFGDGAAAAVLTCGDRPNAISKIGTAGQHLFRDSLDIMGWTVDPIGFGVLLSRTLPRFVEEKLAAPARKFVAAANFHGAPVRYVCHPGGAKVLAAVEAALGLPDLTLADERVVLRRHGNMSAPTVLFVLAQALRHGLAGPAVLSALGPGFTASFVAIDAGPSEGQGNNRGVDQRSHDQPFSESRNG